MDITPVYELQNRLRSTAIAGVNLLQEDFRLKRAAEGIKPLEKASPVFAKLCQQMELLLSESCPNKAAALLDAISLVDAVVCTLGAVEVQKEIETFENGNGENSSNAIINVSYSTLKELIEALTTSGNGHYGYVCDKHESNPELFKDYRVRPAMIKALGASYNELADKVDGWLTEECDKSILPLLMKDFDPKGKKEMVRRVHVIEALAGADANDFYINMLDGAEKDVKLALIHALRFDKNNADLVLGMFESEKGRSKQVCLRVLAYMENGEAADKLKKAAEKKPFDVLDSLQYSNNDMAADIAADILSKCLDGLLEIETELFASAFSASIGKNNEKIYECYRKISENSKNLDVVLRRSNIFFAGRYQPANQNLVYSKQDADNNKGVNSGNIADSWLSCVLQQSYMINPNDKLKSLIMEIYDDRKSEDFLPAALTVKLLGGEDCQKWIDENFYEKKLFGMKIKNNSMNVLKTVLPFIVWDSDCENYVAACASYDKFFDTRNTFAREIDFKMRDKITDMLLKNENQHFDSLLGNWCGKGVDEEYCRRLGGHFYKCAMKYADSAAYIGYLKKCGWTDYKGIAVRHLQLNRELHAWSLLYYIKDMPCDYETKIEEVKTISRMLKSGEIKAKNIRMGELDKMADYYLKQQ